MRRARDWVCDCHAVNLGDRYECFACAAPKSANARAAARQVTAVEDAGPPPLLAAQSVVELHSASSHAARDVQASRPAAYYAAAATRRGGFTAAPFRTAALNAALKEAAAEPRAARGAAKERRQPGRARGAHKEAIDALKAQQQAARVAAEAKLAEERRERERQREARMRERASSAGAGGAPAEAAVGERGDASVGSVDARGEMRVDPNDGNEYTREEFEAYYGGREEWDAAAQARSEL
ncbi:hypothetical protein AB1Y20_003397 [Prymnesium parvum]|uniref:RanBP2-type domain-containing protein n=1 Tax=Prymnesium parvum TaxID=97485 RepID=A0AB34JAS8_PRYPA